MRLVPRLLFSLALLAAAMSVAAQDLSSRWIAESRRHSEGLAAKEPSKRVWVGEVASEKREAALSHLSEHTIYQLTSCDEAELWVPGRAVPCGQDRTAYFLSRAVLTNRATGSFHGRLFENGLLDISHVALGRYFSNPEPTAVLVVAPTLPKAVRIGFTEAN